MNPNENDERLKDDNRLERLNIPDICCLNCPYGDFNPGDININELLRSFASNGGYCCYEHIPGECRRYARHSGQKWPPIMANDWCGEHPKMLSVHQHLESGPSVPSNVLSDGEILGLIRNEKPVEKAEQHDE